MIITIDGPSGTGKSTVAKEVAKRLGYTFFDTGAMYRSLAWKIQKAKINPSDFEKISELLPHFDFHIEVDKAGRRKYFVGEDEVTEEIRSQKISSLASQIAVIPEVRKSLVKIQRRFGRRVNAVFEGRDMGTVVFPDADVKVFLTARPEIRAERRYRDLLTKFPDLKSTLSRDEVLEEIKQRDHQDSTREISPLKQADDAVLIDTSDLKISQVIQKIHRLARRSKTKKYPPMKWSYWFVYTMARLYFKLFFRLRIYGLEHFKRGAAVIAPNHASYFDPPVVSISCPEEVHFLAKESLFKVPLLGPLIRVLNSHPVSRDASDAATFKQILQILSEGKKLILFPEGKRSDTGEFLPLERGLGFLVTKAKCRILPVYVKGTFDAWNTSRKLPKFFGRITCVFGSAIEWDDFEDLPKKDATVEITKRCSESLQELKSWLDQGAKGSPP